MKGIFRVLGGFLLVASPAFGAPFAYIPLAGENKVSVVDLATDKVVTRIPVGLAPEAIAFNPGGARAYVASLNDGKVTPIQTSTNTVTLGGATVVGDVPRSVAVNGALQVAVATQGGSVNGGDGTITVIDRRGLVAVQTGAAPIALAYNPAGDKIYVANSGDATISVVDSSALITVDTIHVDLNPTGLVMDPSGKRFFVQHQAFAQRGNNQVSVVDISGVAHVSAVIPLGSEPQWMALNPSGNVLAVAKVASVSIVDIAASKVLFDVQLPTGLATTGVNFGPDGSKLYVLASGNGNGAMLVYDTTTWQLLDTVDVGNAPRARGTFIQPSPNNFDAPGALSGLWWNPAQSGWGINFTQRHGNILATWFTYDETGKAKWYAVPNCTMPAGSLSCSGSVYQVTGPTFFAIPQYDPSLRNVESVGSLSVAFTDNDHATMSYTVNGTSRSVDIQREVFDTTSFANEVDLTDMWWNPAEPGWGMALTQQHGTIFAAWYVYDANGLPDWLVVPDCQVDPVEQAFCGGLLYHTSGPKFDEAFDPTAVVTTPAGYLRIDFLDSSHLTFDGVAFGAPIHKTITRQLF